MELVEVDVLRSDMNEGIRVTGLSLFVCTELESDSECNDLREDDSDGSQNGFWEWDVVLLLLDRPSYGRFSTTDCRDGAVYQLSRVLASSSATVCGDAEQTDSSSLIKCCRLDRCRLLAVSLRLLHKTIMKTTKIRITTLEPATAPRIGGR